jgi:hypothetical protein
MRLPGRKVGSAPIIRICVWRFDTHHGLDSTQIGG